MPGVNVRRDGVGSPEPTADREHTQVENLCYEGPRASCTPDPMPRFLADANGVGILAAFLAAYNTHMTASHRDPVVRTDLPLGPPIRGKVRDCYSLSGGRHGDAMLIVSTDRISAFDWILPTPIPDKGRVLTAISAFWFDLLSRGPSPIAHHLLTTDVDDMDLPASVDLEPLRGRTMLVKRAEVIPFE